MGRPSKGLRLEWRRGVGYARFTHGGREHLISTSQRDPDAAQSEAERLYRRVTGGAVARPTSTRGLSVAPLPVLFAEWLSSLVGTLDVETLRTYETTYCGKHWLDHYDTLSDMCSRVARERYRSARLKLATAKTVKKETWVQDKFLQWCESNDLIAAESVPRRLKWSKSTLGTRTGKQREHARHLSTADVGAFLHALPEWREVGKRALKKKPFPVRDRYVFAYETGLRPATLDELVWADWTGATLRIRDEVDKIRYGREVPLSNVARGALQRVLVGANTRSLPTGNADTIFGKHRSGKTIARVAKIAGLDGVAPYDLRHARATHMADSGAAITGIGFLVGHRQATTTNRYLHQSERAAILALGTGNHSDNPVRTGNDAPEVGWPTGLEPATSGATRQQSRDAAPRNKPLETAVSGTETTKDCSGRSGEPSGSNMREADGGSILVAARWLPRGVREARRGPFPLAEATLNLACLLAGVTP